MRHSKYESLGMIITYPADNIRIGTAVDRALDHMQRVLGQPGMQKTCWFYAAGFAGCFDYRFTRCALGKLIGMELAGGVDTGA
jgi:hypothetical protein